MDDPTFKIGDGGEVVPVDLTYERVLCPQHGEPFRTDWPDGFAEFSKVIFETLTKTEGFTLIGGSSRLIHEALERSPICERIEKHALLGAYHMAGFGVVAECDVCEVESLGAPYQARVSAETVNFYSHLCFRCVVYSMERAN